MITAALLSVLATLAVAAPAPAPVGPVKLGLTAIHQPLQIPKKGDVRHRPSPQNGVAPYVSPSPSLTEALPIGAAMSDTPRR